MLVVDSLGAVVTAKAAVVTVKVVTVKAAVKVTVVAGPEKASRSPSPARARRAHALSVGWEGKARQAVGPTPVGLACGHLEVGEHRGDGVSFPRRGSSNSGLVREQVARGQGAKASQGPV